MGYRIHKADDTFNVVEVNEGEVRNISSSKDEAKAKTLQRHLNFGGGFAGWTPEFFLSRLVVSV